MIRRLSAIVARKVWRLRSPEPNIARKRQEYFSIHECESDDSESGFSTSRSVLRLDERAGMKASSVCDQTRPERVDIVNDKEKFLARCFQAAILARGKGHTFTKEGDGNAGMSKRSLSKFVNTISNNQGNELIGDMVYSYPNGDEGYSNPKGGEGFEKKKKEKRNCLQATLTALGKGHFPLEDATWKAGSTGARISGLMDSVERSIRRAAVGWRTEVHIKENVKSCRELEKSILKPNPHGTCDLTPISLLRRMGHHNNSKKSRKHNRSSASVSKSFEGMDVDKGNTKRNRKELDNSNSLDSSIVPRSLKTPKVENNKVPDCRNPSDTDIKGEDNSSEHAGSDEGSEEGDDITPEQEEELLNPSENETTGDYVTSNEEPHTVETDPTSDISENLGNFTIGEEGEDCLMLARNSTPYSGQKGMGSKDFTRLDDLDLKLPIRLQMQKNLLNDLNEFDGFAMVGKADQKEAEGSPLALLNSVDTEVWNGTGTYEGNCLNKSGRYIIPRKAVDRDGASGSKASLNKLKPSGGEQKSKKRAMQDINESRKKEKQEREANFPHKMAIYSNNYHEEGDQLLEDEAVAIKSYLEFQFDMYKAGDQPMGVVDFADGGLKAGMLIVDCKDENSGDWLTIAINSIKEEAPYTLPNRENWGLDCSEIKVAKPLKTFLIINANPAHSWYDTVNKAKGLGYETEKWYLLHIKRDVTGRSFTFMDGGNTFREMDRLTRSRTHPSSFGASKLFIKWLKGEDEPVPNAASTELQMRLPSKGIDFSAKMPKKQKRNE